MARKRKRQRLSKLSDAWAAFAGHVGRRWAPVRLWFKRHSRDNVILAVFATIGAAVSRPFNRFRKRTRDNVVFGALAVAVVILLAVAFLSDRGGPGTQLVRAAEAPTTVAQESTTTSTLPALAPVTPPDITPPPLLLDPGLTDGLKVGTNHIVVSGITDPGAKVVVAGIELAADDAGGWAADVPLGLGANRIDIVTTDSAGNATGAAFTVIYEVDAPPPPPKQAPKRVVVTTTSIAPATTARVTTTAAKKAGTTSPSTTLATTTTRKATTTTPVTDEHGHVLFPTTSAAGATTTRATTTTKATTTTQATTTTHLTTTTTEPTTTTTEMPSTTTTEVPSTTTTGEDTTVPPTDPPSTDPPDTVCVTLPLVPDLCV